jgi:hypothetical protein
MSDLIQVVCIDDEGTNDKEWGALSEVSIKENNVYWGSYVNKGNKIMRPSYFIYENYEDTNSLIGVFDATRFITLAEWRDKQIDNILND